MESQIVKIANSKNSELFMSQISLVYLKWDQMSSPITVSVTITTHMDVRNHYTRKDFGK